MGIRFRKSVRLGSGVRLNLSKSGLGASFGIPGMHYGIGADGRHRTSVGIPGTGIYSVSEVGAEGRPRSRSRSPGSRGAPPASVPMTEARKVLPKPGWLASSAEKHYYAGVQAYLVDDFGTASSELEACIATNDEALSAHLLAALAEGNVDESTERIVRHLELVATSDEALPDRLQSKYLPPDRVNLAMAVKITEHVTAQVPFSSAGAAMALAERYQETGRLPEAIGVVVQLHEEHPEVLGVRLSLADLLYADGDDEGVLEAASDVTNVSNVAVGLIHLRAKALLRLAHVDSAFEAFRAALAKTADRDPELLKAVRYDRGSAFEANGSRAKAKSDFERIYAMDPNYRDVEERLTALAG